MIKSYVKVNNFSLLIIFITLLIVFTWLQQEYVAIPQLTNMPVVDDAVKGRLIENFYKYRWVGFLTAPLILLLRITLTTLCLFIGGFLDEAMPKQNFRQWWNVVLVSMIFLAVYFWEIALVSVVCAPVFFWIIYRDNKRIIRQQTEVMGSYAVTESNFISTITGIATIKNFGRQDIFGKLNRMLYSIFQDRVFSLGKTQIRIGVLSGIASVLIMTGLVAYGAMSVFHGRMTTGELMAVLGITGSLFPAVASLALVAIPVNEAKVAFDRMFEIIGAGEDTDESREAPVLHDVKKLCIENLSFRFTGRKLLLEDVDRETERFVCNILDTLRNLFITVFVTHRLETAKKLADRIYVISGGRVQASGTHEQLMATDNFYSEYWKQL